MDVFSDDTKEGDTVYNHQKAKQELKSRFTLDRRTIGSVVGVVAGCVWGIGGAIGLPRPWQAWAVGSSIGISVVLIAALAMTYGRRQLGTFRPSIYGMAVAFETGAIFTAIWLLERLRLPQFLLPAIGFIVGLHFLGLWKATDLRVFLWIALVMCIVCGLAAFLPGVTKTGDVDLRTVVAGLGSALVLWGAGLRTLL